MAKDREYNRLIHTARWLRLRRGKLTECPLCERCAERGRVNAATEVHHIVPVENGLTLQQKAALMYDRHNLMALCHACHVEVHTEMGRGGKARARKVAREHLMRFAEKFLGKEGNDGNGGGA